MTFAPRYMRWAAGLSAVLIVGLAVAAPSLAQERGSVGNLIRDLYGGDGITLPVDFHEAHFTIEQNTDVERLFALNDDIARGVSFAPFSSTGTSIVFDIEEGIPVRTRESLGPLLLQRASTIGKGRMSFGFSYTRVDYQEFEGDDLDDLEVNLRHVDCCTPSAGPFPDNVPDGQLGGGNADFELDQIRVNLDVEIEQDIFAFFGTYGITDDWDASVVVPIISIDATVRSEAEVLPLGGPNTPHVFLPTGSPDDTGIDSNSADATGIGDILLRSKYNFLRDQPVLPDAAVLGQASLPTGDEDDLLGTGETGLLGMLIGSKELGRFTPHLNLGYEVFTGDDFEDNLRYGAGLEVMVLESLTGVTEVIGRYEPDGDGTGDIVDAVVGAKWNPVSDVVLASNFLVPINKDTGLRADFIWGLGIELSF